MGLAAALEHLAASLRQLGLTLNWAKSSWCCTRLECAPEPLVVAGHGSLPWRPGAIRVLGVLLDPRRLGTDTHWDSVVSRAWAQYNLNRPLIAAPGLSLARRVQVLQTLVGQAILYASGAVPPGAAARKLLRRVQRRMLCLSHRFSRHPHSP